MDNIKFGPTNKRTAVMQTTQKGTLGSKAQLEEVIELHYGEHSSFFLLKHVSEFPTILNTI